MALLSATPDLISICNSVLGHSNPGDGREQALAAAAYFPYRFDPAYVGYTGQAKFGLYGDPLGDCEPDNLVWEYYQTTTKTFLVSTNKSSWSFGSQCDYDLFTVSVWNSTNTVQLFGGAYPNNAIVRVTPKATNGTGANKYGTLYITNLDYMMEGCTVSLTQKYNGAGNPPIPVIGCDDLTMGFSYKYTSIALGSNSLWYNFTPTGITPAPPRTIYMTVKKSGPVTLYSGTIPNCYNDAARSGWVTISEAAVEGRYYYVNLTTSNL
jgi:hypothetical protein